LPRCACRVVLPLSDLAAATAARITTCVTVYIWRTSEFDIEAGGFVSWPIFAIR